MAEQIRPPQPVSPEVQRERRIQDAIITQCEGYGYIWSEGDRIVLQKIVHDCLEQQNLEKGQEMLFSVNSEAVARFFYQQFGLDIRPYVKKTKKTHRENLENVERFIAQCNQMRIDGEDRIWKIR